MKCLFLFLLIGWNNVHAQSSKLYLRMEGLVIYVCNLSFLVVYHFLRVKNKRKILCSCFGQVTSSRREPMGLG